MVARSLQVGLILLIAGAACCGTAMYGRQAEPPPVPKGVEVQARGPVHEAFASLTAEAEPTKPVSKRPPKPINEMPPEEKPDGDVVWIGGYWAWDDERSDFLWVSGTWRALPPGRTWVAGYWREDGANWRWVPGFWAEAPKAEAESHEVTYLAQPPAPPEVAPPPKPEQVECFFVPGHWVWDGVEYRWKAGYWARVEPGYVWVNAHYRWTPGGYIYVPGYWDLAVSRRGILYAPVIITPEVVTVGYVYTPYYAVRDTVVLDALFVRPCYCHYYFGDYYGPVYRDYGYESCIVYSRRRYDSIIVYESWERRSDPRWVDVQINIYNDRYAGRAPVPPRTLVQQTNIVNVTNVTNVTNVYNAPVLAAPAQVAREKGTTVVRLDNQTRQQAWQQAVNVQQVAAQRTQVEAPLAPGQKPAPHAASLSAVNPQPVKQGFVAAKAPPAIAPAVHQATSQLAPKTSTGAQPPGSHPPGTGTAPPGSHPPGTGTPPPGAHPPGTGTAPPGSHPPGTGTPPPGSHPPGTGTAPPGSHPPGTGTAPPGTRPPGMPPPGTRPPVPPPGHKPPPPDDKDKKKDKDSR
jgi:hypothetical protein